LAGSAAAGNASERLKTPPAKSPKILFILAPVVCALRG
jgi:hypothetical protein